jgi:hypothetical protein
LGRLPLLVELGLFRIVRKVVVLNEDRVVFYQMLDISDGEGRTRDFDFETDNHVLH